MRVIVATFMGLVALAVAQVQAAPNPDKDNWVQLGAARSFELGDQACGVGSASGPPARLVVGNVRSDLH